MSPQADLYEQYLELKRSQFPTLPRQEKGLYQKYLESKEKREPELADWKKELPGAIKETLKELPVVKGWSKFVTEQVPSGEFWKRAGETARSQLQQFIREKVLDPREFAGYESIMEEKKPRKKVSLKEIGKQGLNFITFLPVTFDKFVQNPGEVIEKEPLSFLMLATVLAKGGSRVIKAKAASGKPVVGKDIHRVVDEMPGNLLTRKQKLGIKSKIPEQMELPLRKLEAPVQYSKTLYRGVSEEKIYGAGGALYGKGEYWTADRGMASKFAQGGKVLKNQVSLENPFVATGEAVQRLGRTVHRNAMYAGKGMKVANELAAKAIRRKLEAKGYDGIVIKQPTGYEEVIVFHPEKSIGKPGLPVASRLPLKEIELITPAQKIMNALKEAKPLRAKQEALYTAERAKRFKEAQKVGKEITGEKGFYAEKAKLKGELPKVEFEPIRNKLTQADVEAMFKQVVDSPALDYLETLPAREGLAKLFGEYGGKVPTANELTLLNRVFGNEFVRTILTKRARWDKIKTGMLEAANIPRALMASYDLSFGLRQGIFLAARYPKEFVKTFATQFKLFGSEKAFKALGEEIRSRPTYKLMMGGKRKLALTEMDAALSLREEAFMGAAWAEKIPVVGLGVRASARAYTGFANKLRADVFDHLVKSAEKTGRNPWKEPKLVESIVDFVNAGSGRGSLKMLEKAAVNLNTVLFSPRLISSRLNLLNPHFYIKLDPFVRKQALQSLLAFTGMTTTVLGLAKLSGAEVSLDPRSADFAKIKIANTRLDIMGGFQQYIRTAAQFLSGRTVSTTTGRVSVLGEGYKPQTRLGILSRGAEYKLAPVASFAVNLLRGQTTFGEPMSVPEEVAKRFVPMVIQDMNDLAKIDPELLPTSVLGIFGVGIQTYGPRKKEGVVY